eukprot:1007290-Prymnesium_polylepis.1
MSNVTHQGGRDSTVRYSMFVALRHIYIRHLGRHHSVGVALAERCPVSALRGKVHACVYSPVGLRARTHSWLSLIHISEPTRRS